MWQVVCIKLLVFPVTAGFADSDFFLYFDELPANRASLFRNNSIEEIDPEYVFMRSGRSLSLHQIKDAISQ